EPQSARRDGRHHEQGQEGAHPVIGKPLPELREEKNGQPLWLPGEALATALRHRLGWRILYGSSLHRRDVAGEAWPAQAPVADGQPYRLVVRSTAYAIMLHGNRRQGPPPDDRQGKRGGSA